MKTFDASRQDWLWEVHDDIEKRKENSSKETVVQNQL